MTPKIRWPIRLGMACATEGFREGIRAFQEKKTPQVRGAMIRRFGSAQRPNSSSGPVIATARITISAVTPAPIQIAFFAAVLRFGPSACTSS